MKRLALIILTGLLVVGAVNAALHEPDKVRQKIEGNLSEKECPKNCTCTGSAVRCFLQNGTREMTIIAGKSGNKIIQVKEINATTNVTLYKSEDGKMYAVLKNNETQKIRMFPDQVKEKIKEKLNDKFVDEEIFLDDDGTYKYESEKNARLFGVFPVKIKVRAELNPETGKIIQIKKSWWTFLAVAKQERMVGLSCGTVTPGMNNECCQNKGYEIWNSETNECEFAEEDSENLTEALHKSMQFAQ